MANGVKGKTIIAALLSQGPIAAATAAGVLSVSGDSASPFYPLNAGTVATNTLNPWASPTRNSAPPVQPWINRPGNFEFLLIGLIALVLFLE